MGRGIFTKQNNQWCSVKNIWTKHNGVWCPVKKVYTKVNGQWCLCFPPITSCGDTTLESIYGKGYSSGLDVVLREQEKLILRCEDGLFGHSDITIQVNLYDSDGTFITNFAEIVDPFGEGGEYAAFSGSVKVDPTPLSNGHRRIWFCVTGNEESHGAWYSFTVDSNFTVATSSPTCELLLPGAFGIDFDPNSGRAFLGGKENNAWSDPFALFLDSGSKVIEIGGYSAGFAFTPDGTLCVGSYTSVGPVDQQDTYVFAPADQQYIYVFTPEQVQSAIAETVLTPADAANTIALYNPNGIFLGVSDIISDSSGNIYVSANGGWDETYNSDMGCIFKISNPLTAPDLTESDIIFEGTMRVDEPDWLKALACKYSCLHIAQDFSWRSGGPDVIIEECV